MVTKSDKLYRFSLWIIRLRWLGVLCIFFVTYVASEFLQVSIQTSSLYKVTVFFFLLNGFHFLLLRRMSKIKSVGIHLSIRLLANIQISTDFLVLTILLHYSGGIENPFIIYYLFHMIMASILLVPRDSYLQATIGLFLIGILGFTEYAAILPHYPLLGYASHDLFQNELYLLTTGMIFMSTSYLIVFITTSIIAQTRIHEEAYLRANRELNKKDEIKNEYVLRITHDIKGHLAAIQSCLNVLENKTEESISNECKEYLSTASRRTSVLIRFVKDLLKLTKLKLNNEFEVEAFPVRDSIQKIINSLELSALEKSITIHTDIEDSVEMIEGYQLSIEELVANLLENAISYSSEKGDVLLNIKNLKKEILFEIQDDGPGIPDGEQVKIFDEFYRGTNIKEASDGTGLGLAIAKKIVQTHGGKIWFENTAKKGTKFSFTLPVKNHASKSHN